MNAATPGQAAYEAAGTPLSDYLRERGRPGVADMIEDAERDLVAAQEPRAAPELAAAMRETRELRELFDKATTAIMTRRWALTEPEKRIIAGFRQQAGLTS